MHFVNHENSIIEVRNLSFTYGKREVLRDVSFDVHRGDYLGIVGPNGAGKTTLIKLILGLLPIQKDSVKIFGVDLHSFKEKWNIGYVPQHATNIDSRFPATVEEIILMGRYAKRGLFRRVTEEDRNAVSRSLTQVGLSKGYEKRLIGDLSGGEQQRVFIARALVSEPSIILLDEPTTGVDQGTREVFFDLIKKLNQELELTLLLISHDIESVGYGAMHIAYVDTVVTFYSSLDLFLQEKNLTYGKHNFSLSV